MNVTPEVIEAVAYLRNWMVINPNMKEAFDVLDNAGVFKEIDDATGYDVNPQAEPVSKCTCPAAMAHHLEGCPGDPEEWGDLATTTR